MNLGNSLVSFVHLKDQLAAGLREMAGQGKVAAEKGKTRRISLEPRAIWAYYGQKPNLSVNGAKCR
jgi:hypothetical protein